MSSIIFYGAGKNAEVNFDKWVSQGLKPVCFADADTSKHHKMFGRGEIEILPLIEAIRIYPDYEIYLTPHKNNLGPIITNLLGVGIPLERIKSCDNPNNIVNISDYVEAGIVYPQLYKIFSALQDDLSNVLFWASLEASLAGTFRGVYKAMIHPLTKKWLSTKCHSVGKRIYGINGIWELLSENYPMQKNEIYLYIGIDDIYIESEWMIISFLDVCSRIGIILNGIVVPEGSNNKQLYGQACVLESDFIKQINQNTRLIVCSPVGFSQTKDILERFSFSETLCVSISDAVTPQYFEPDILPPINGEIFVDVGVYNLGTSIDFVKYATKGYEKIYAFEPDKNCFEVSMKRLNELGKLGELDESKVELINKGLSRKSGFLSFPKNYNPQGGDCNETIDIEVISLDEYLQGKPVTFIKMDVEGAEMDVLLGMKKTIQKYKPKLAICIYHKNEDIFDIPSFILNLVPEYKLYIRHYNSEPRERVLLATI